MHRTNPPPPPPPRPPARTVAPGALLAAAIALLAALPPPLAQAQSVVLLPCTTPHPPNQPSPPETNPDDPQTLVRKATREAFAAEGYQLHPTPECAALAGVPTRGPDGQLQTQNDAPLTCETPACLAAVATATQSDLAARVQLDPQTRQVRLTIAASPTATSDPDTPAAGPADASDNASADNESADNASADTESADNAKATGTTTPRPSPGPGAPARGGLGTGTAIAEALTPGALYVAAQDALREANAQRHERAHRTLLVLGNPVGASVVVDGQIVGGLPYSGSIPTGPHEIRIQRQGYLTRQINLQVGPKPAHRFVIDLIPVQPPDLAPPLIAATALAIGGAGAITAGIAFDSTLGADGSCALDQRCDRTGQDAALAFAIAGTAALLSSAAVFALTLLGQPKTPKPAPPPAPAPSKSQPAEQATR